MLSKHITYWVCTNLIYLFLLSVWILSQWYLKNGINNHLQIFTVSFALSGIDNLPFPVCSLIHEWCHLGAILWFHVIIHIFITIHPFWTKESTNQVILSISIFPVRTCPRARCAVKVEIQNFHVIWIPDTTIDVSIHLQSLLTFQKAVRARQSWKSRACCYRATRLELASKKGGFVTLFSFSLHSNVEISVKWIGIVMKVVLF